MTDAGLRGPNAPIDPKEMPAWEQRFRAPTIGFPRWARHAPDRLAVTSNESGSWQVYAWDRKSDTRRQVTDEPIGVNFGACTPDGSGVVWFHDVTGDEVGHWLLEPFEGASTALGHAAGRRPLVPGLEDAWSAGLALGDHTTAVGTATEDGFAVHVAAAGGEPRLLHRHEEMLEVAGLSRDDALLVLEHAEHGDTIHPAVRVLDSRTGQTVGDQWDGDGLGLSAARWSRVAGDHRLALVHERDGVERPAIWNLRTGVRTDIRLDVPGDVSVVDWWPNADALLLLQDHDGRNQLYRYHLGTQILLPLAHAPGTITGAGVRPDGEVWFRVANGATPPAVRSARWHEVCAPDGPKAPKGQPFRSWEFTNAEGQRVHGFVATPKGDGPHPVVMLVHGGPTWAYTDSFLPDVQAWVDHGVAVAMVNYRGSTGYGVAFRDALIGNPGFPEVADVVAGLDSLAHEGFVDPARAAISGASWGGYVSLLAVGLHPERWRAAVAAVPVADYVTAYRDEAPGLQAFDRSLFGGSPDEVGDLYRQRSPLTYVDRVRTPVLIIAGDNDSRCPIQQVLNYVNALKAGGGEVEVVRFDAGHGSMIVDVRVKHMRDELAFVLPRLGLELR